MTYLQIMFTGSDIAGIDALHPSLLQGFEFLEGVKVMGDRLAAQLDLDRVETEGFAAGQRYEYRDLRVGRIEQLLFKLIQFRGNGQHIALDFLNLFIQALDLLPGDFLRIRDGVQDEHRTKMTTLDRQSMFASSYLASRLVKAPLNLPDQIDEQTLMPVVQLGQIIRKIAEVIADSHLDVIAQVAV
jgi:hypothetical protein